jgi:serine/threonine protein kinase
LNHPNLVTVYDFGNEDGQPYLVMEFVEGRSLEAVIAERRPAPERAARILCQLCDGLAYAHAKGILHRDIKPGNNLVGDDGTARIGDFGLARALTGGRAVMQRSGKPLGTPGYAAPEVYEVNRPLDLRSDIYALGALLYEMLTGQAPTDKDPVPPSVLARTPPAFDAVIARAMAPSPLQRFASAVDMKATVLSALQAPRTHGVPTGRLTVTGEATTAGHAAPRTGRGSRVAVAGFLMLAAGALAWGIFGRGGQSTQPTSPTAADEMPAVTEGPDDLASLLNPSIIPPVSPPETPPAQPPADTAANPPAQPPPPRETPPPTVASSSTNAPDNIVPEQPPPAETNPQLPPIPVEPADPAKVLAQLKAFQNGGERPPGFGEIIEGPSGHRYLAVEAKLKWHQAREIAKEVGGHLVTITSLEEQHFVHDRAVGSIGPIQPRKQFWLGATDELIEGQWRWVTGEPWEFTSWGRDEPDAVPEKNFLSLMTAPRRPGQGWSDSGEYSANIVGFIVEWEAGASSGQTPAVAATSTTPTQPPQQRVAWNWAVEQLHAVVDPIIKAHEQKVSALSERYAAALQRAANGDESTRTEITAEIERFQSSGDVPDQSPAGAHTEIVRLQNIWRQEHGKLRGQLKEELLKFQPSYIRALEDEREKYVNDDKKAEAEAIFAEITRLNQHAEAFLSLATRSEWK